MLALVALGAAQARSFVASSVYGEARQSAGADARLIADLGFAAALADGQFDTNDLRAATKEFAAARRSHPLLAVVVWSPRGDVLYTAGGLVRRTRAAFRKSCAPR